MSNHSSTPGQSNGFHGASGSALSITAYEPRAVAPSLVKPIATPANNHSGYRDLAQKQKDRLRRNQGIVPARGMMMPGSTYTSHLNGKMLIVGAGFTGPNIYVRLNNSLASGVPTEVKYALHHLVKISHERGEKFKFEQFNLLADELLHVICKVSTLWFEHPGWEYTYENRDSNQPNLLNELNGTSNLLAKIGSFRRQAFEAVRDDDFNSDMADVNSASLIVRNMALLDDNARYMAKKPLVRDMMTIVLQLPRVAATLEARLNALEIAEQLTKYWVLGGSDALYLSLIQTVESNPSDRGIVITGLRALIRISLNLEAPNTLQNIPPGILTRIYQWLLVPDDDIQGACLDFLYQYTAIDENVQHLVDAGVTEALVNVLMTFLMQGALRVPSTIERPDTPVRSVSNEASEVLPKLATSIMENICLLPDAKEQSSAW
jgi:chromatin structure-remodeling complex subunit RSC9